MNKPVEKRAGRDHHSGGAESPAILKFDTRGPPLVEDEINNFSLPEMQIRSRFERLPHLAAISQTIGLCAWRLHCGTTRTIQQAKLNARPINHTPHDSAKRIDLSHEMTFGNSADSRITRHLSNEIQIERDEPSLGAESRGRRRGFAPGVAGANHDYIETLVKRHHLLPNTKCRENFRQYILSRCLAGDLP
jgi:hypothetical protein